MAKLKPEDCKRAAESYGEAVRAHVIKTASFFAFALAINAGLIAAHGEAWTWLAFTFGIYGGVFGTLVYYWPQIRRFVRR